MKKASFLDAHVVKILDHPKQQWNYHRRKTMGSKRFAGLQDQVDWSLFNPKDYLFTHDTIVASVKVAKDGYTIVDPCHELVNANGNAWSNQVLSHAFRTFIGKPNFYQHYQIQGFEKGLILDAVLRPVTYVGSNGKKAQIFYVDILVATNRKHKDIVKRIVDGQLTTMSMGCSCAYVQCSYCGKIFKDDQQQCQHLQRHIGQFLDRNGEKVMVSQLIGALDKDGNYIQGSCQFIQASWVQNPAFEGAVLNYFLYEDDIKKNTQASKIASQKWVLQDLFSDNRIAKLRVADKYSGIAVQLMRMQKDQQKFLQIAKSVYNKGK